VCITLCTIVAHNIAQNRPDSFPPYPPDNHHCSDDVYLREGGGDIMGAMVIVWRVRGKIIGSVLCNIVCINCARCNVHTYEQT